MLAYYVIVCTLGNKTAVEWASILNITCSRPNITFTVADVRSCMSLGAAINVAFTTTMLPPSKGYHIKI